MKTSRLFAAAILSAIVTAILACAVAAAAEPEPAPAPGEDPAALIMCVPSNGDAEADTCGDDPTETAAPMSTAQAQTSCTACWSFCHGYGACFNCCCFGQC